MKRHAFGNAVGGMLVASALMLATTQVQSQAPGSSSTPGASSQSNGGSSEIGTAVQAQQQLAVPGPAVNPTSSTSQSGTDPSFRGSIVSGKATADVLQLSLDDAMQRGLRTNLGLILQSSSERQANGQRLQQL